MKKIVLAILALVMSLNVFSQTDTFKVKDDSFHKIEGCITIPARYDDNDAAMAVVKIIPENINEQDRAEHTDAQYMRAEMNLERIVAVFVSHSAVCAVFYEDGRECYRRTFFIKNFSTDCRFF